MLKTALLITAQLLIAQPLALAQDAAHSGGRGANAQATPQPSSRGRHSQKPPNMPEVRIFKVKHIQASEVANLISNLMHSQSTYAVNRTNSIIYSGPTESIPKVEKLLQQLDVPVEETLSDSEITVVPISERNVDELARHLNKMKLRKGRRGIDIVADKSRSRILLSGPSDLIANARAVIAELDIPAGSVNLEFTFFKARLNADAPSPKMPADLEPLVKELQRFGQLELLGQLSAVAVEDEKFAVSGSIGDLIDADVRGTVITAPAGGSVRVSLETSVRLESPKQIENPSNDKKRGSRRQPEFRLSTSVSVQRGDYVVLGSAPNGWKAGESAILVMRAQPEHSAR